MTVPFRPTQRSPEEMQERAARFHDEMGSRRSVRSFSADPVPRNLIELAIKTASTAPSGAHRQPWKFVAISDVDTKRRIRQAAEKEERINYAGRMNDEWQEALGPLGTTWEKPFLETAPWIVVLFEERYGIGAQGEHITNYYVKESVGIAAGVFITALHHMGLATLTHTPSPMAFLRALLGRPENERPFVLFPIGFPSPDCQVPDLNRKSLDQVMITIN